MEMVTVWTMVLGSEKKELRIGLVDEDNDLEVTNIMESEHGLFVYMKALDSKTGEWTGEFLGGKYVNIPFYKVQMPAQLLDEGEKF